MAGSRKDQLDAVFGALSDPTRRRVLDLLKGRARTTGELAEACSDLSRFAVMKHLGVLERAGLVVVRREGRVRWNHLNAVPLRRVYERWVSRYEDRWAGALLSLKRAVEGESAPPLPPLPPSRPESQMAESVQTGRLVKVEQEVVIAAPPERVFRAITTETGEWWPHRFKDDAKVVLEAEVGGRFYEDWGGGRGALYAHVTYIDAPNKLCTRGPMGLRSNATAVKWYHLEKDGMGTRVRVSLELFGDISEEQAASYRAGSKAVLESALKPYVERGKKYVP